MTEKEQEIFEKLLDTKFSYQNQKLDQLDSRLDSLEVQVGIFHNFRLKSLAVGSVTTFFGSVIAFMVGTAIDFLNIKN